MGIQDDFDILDFESELLHVLRDQRRGLRQRAVDEDVTFGRSDEDRAQAVRADVVCVAENLKRRLLLVPGFASLAVDGSGDSVDRREDREGADNARAAHDGIISCRRDASRQ
jgi:putative NADH-flavin reductase